ncbi:MAG: hypothetical protein QXR97_00825 [Thermoproteota archaeon]
MCGKMVKVEKKIKVHRGGKVVEVMALFDTGILEFTASNTHR